MHTTPVPLRLRQSPPAASTPAPGPHTSRSTGLFSQTGLRTSAYPDYSGAFSVTGWAILRPKLLNRPFQPHGILEHRMSLSTLVSFRRRSAAANSGMLATPVSFRLSQNPLGAYHLPQAPTSVASEDTFVSLGGTAISSTLVDSYAAPFFLTESRAVM